MRHPYLAKRYWKLETTAMSGSGNLLYQFDDIINFSLGDPDVTTDARIIEQAFEDVRNGATHYTDFYGERPLREAILEMYEEDYGHRRQLGEVMVTTSGCHAMWLVMEAILDDGDEVIIHEPYFTPYPSQIRLARGVPVILQTREEDDWQVVPERLEDLITERTKAIILNTPGNPTGSCFSQETLEAVARIAAEHDLVVVADDIYTSFSYAAPFVPFTTLPGMAERTITIGSFSKNFAMTGWRIGYILAPEFIVETVKDINENNVFTAPAPSQRAAYHALKLRHEIQPGLVAEYRGRSQRAYEEICRTPHMTSAEPQGALYLWVNISETGLSDVEVTHQIFEQAHVLTLPGSAFGPHCSRYIRLAMCVSQEQIGDAFERIRKMPLFSE